MGPNDNLLDFLLELQVLDRVPRMGFLLRGVARPESVAAHSWHVAFLVWILGVQMPEIDAAHALELALIHDLAEARLGDLPRTTGRYLPRDAKHDAERLLLGEMAGPEADRIVALLDEYQRGESPEARLVKACDKLQLMIKIHAYERWQEGALTEFWDNEDNFPDGGFPQVRELFAALQQRRRT
jgi:putative hydrolase of HD superfamily